MDEVKKKNIAVEVNPISNQVLKLVENLQNHPATVLISYGIPVVISNDDPAFWQARGLTHDFYETAMAILPVYSGLKALKQLAINSITYSALNKNEQEMFLGKFNKKWDQFIADAKRKNCKFESIYAN